MKHTARMACFAVLLSLLNGLVGLDAIAQDPSQQEETQRVDYLGDPLPPAALLRLGTVRFSPGNIGDSISSSDDQIVVSLGSSLIGWNAATGQQLWSVGKGNEEFQSALAGSSASYGFRPIVRMPKSNRFLLPSGRGKFQFIDFTTGAAQLAFTSKARNQICTVDVHRDERLFAIGTPQALFVCDASGATKFKIENNPAKPLNQDLNSGDRLKFGGDFSYAQFSPVGENLVMVNSEEPNLLRVLNAQTGEESKRIPTKDRVVRFAFDPSGRLLATTERDIAARLYDLESGNVVWERIFSPAGLDERYTTDISFSPTENLLAVGTAIGEDHRIHLLDPANGETVGTLTGHTWKPWRVNFSSDGKRLFSTGWDGVIRVWDVERREQVRIGNSERASSVCTLTQDGRLLAYGDDSGKVHVVESQTGKKLRTIDVNGYNFSQMAFAADNKTLAAGGSSSASIAIFVWNLDQEDPIHRWEWPKGRDVHSSVTSLSLTPDAKRLAVAVFRQSKCFVFDLPSNRQVAELDHPSVYGLGLHTDGQQLVTAGWDSKVRVWNVDTGEVSQERNHELLEKGENRMYGVKFSPDEQRIAALNMSGSVSILDLELNSIRQIPIEERPVYDCFAFSKNGLWVAVGQMGGNATVIDVQSGEQLWLQQCHRGHIYNIEFGPDDRTLLTGGEDGVNYVWDLNRTPKTPDVDCAEIAGRLFRDDGRAAFDAFQYLATRPAEALPAIVARVEEQFATFNTEDRETIDRMVQRFERKDALEKAESSQLSELGLGTIFAIEQVVSEKLATLEEDDPRLQNLSLLREQLNRRVWAIGRAFYLVAILETTEAQQQLQSWVANSPKLNLKKQAFMAKKYRDLWHSRVESPQD